MKVAYICADPGIPVFGRKGASVHIQEVLRALLQRGAEVTLFAQRLGEAVPEAFQALTVQSLAALPSGKDAEARARAALAANPTLISQLNDAGPFDLVYERYSLWSHAGMTYSREAGCRSVLEVNAPLIDEQRTWRELPFETEAEEVLRQALAAAGTIIAVSPGVKAWLDGYPQTGGRTHVVANGVNLQRFSGLARHEGTIPTVGFLGTLKPWHGVQTLTAAFALLHQRGRRVRLSIVGDGPEYATIHRWLEERGLLAATHFAGAVPPDAVPALLAEMDIGVAPYPQMTGFYFSPLKIYEYMAAGAAVIASHTGHLAEVVSDERTGLLVPPDNPQALCEAIERLLDDDALRQRLGSAGRQQVASEHGWDRVVAHILQLAGLQ
ncbi:glycosyltransferase involved in cell wall biosynthesis [Enterobacter sp. BIGb0383]|uniref:glycosyltransferase family 4 protein n=1 Tax=unclassified Enterobacter TaxID=2608935 RepID=UPI000F463C57|nr:MULTISPECIES: glycosyltransferase family 4 protein [unclassified Enterobacter]ROP58164.1 glycosyltransferase involved in cell wall biosynthesis [Enterobacter sp. BIGb0383]ROS06948.1 glycosyltransferase involved in cell wall biosynthesis [Enterobacter sp. BIGb0359]